MWAEKSHDGGADADRPHARDLLELVRRPHLEVALVLGGEGGVQLVDPGVDPDLVAARDHRALLIRVQHRDHCGHEEGRGHVVPREEPQYSGHRGPGAVLALAELARRAVAPAKGQRLVVGIEGEGHCATGSPRPRCGLERAPRADLLDDGTPALLRPGPGIGLGGLSVCGSAHVGSL